LHASRLLQEVLCDDLELRQLTVNVEPDRVSLTIHPKRGRQEIKAVIDENSVTEHAVCSMIGARWPSTGGI
jgi:hypothetical protein